MNDWNNWEVGDIVLLTDNEGGEAISGGHYLICDIDGDDNYLRVRLDIGRTNHFWPFRGSVEWHSRPNPVASKDFITPFEKWCESNGCSASDEFVVVSSECGGFDVGTIVKLHTDTGDMNDVAVCCIDNISNYRYHSFDELRPHITSTCGVENPQTEWTDSHYNSYYKLSEADIEKGEVKIDPYFVAKHWKLGAKDDTGILAHCLKTIARFGDKNPVEREIVALHKQIKRLAELEGISLDV